MDIYEAIRTRKSVRSFKDKPVEEAKLTKILGAARFAPSASNRQEWRFVVVTVKEKRERLAAAAGQSFIAEAPVVLACCADTDNHVMRCGHLCYPIDVAIAIDHITLAAVAEGLGTCWIGAFDQEPVKNILNIPENIIVVELMPIGYPNNPESIAKRRLALDEIIHHEKW
ncbi:MAG: nitroreductase [Spirochaeta sp.]|nr:nitroreductase [Spirochaeta sp.]